MPSLTLERLRSLLHYDPASGNFTWKLRASNRIKIGDVAGSLSSVGYTAIRVDGKLYQAHRLAWFYSLGEWPANDIDHRNRTRTSNQINNLRDVTRTVNQQNQDHAHRGNKSGHLGVSWHKSKNAWRARIKVEGKEVFLGHFKDKEVAALTYQAAKMALHQGCQS